MGEGSLGIGYAIVILAPFILVAALALTGFIITGRAKTTGTRRIGIAIMVLVALGVVVPPLVNAGLQSWAGANMRAASQIPETLDFKGAAVLEVNMPLFDCDAICEVLVQTSDASGIWATELGEGSEGFYRPGAFDLTQLRGFKRAAEAPYLHQSAQSLPRDIEFVLIRTTHWLNYHDPQAVIKFPDDAYQGIFIYAVKDSAAFDIAKAEPLAMFWQQATLSPPYLWFSETSNDQSRPRTVEVAELIRSALCDSC